MKTYLISFSSIITPWIPLISVILSGITSLLVCKIDKKYEEKKFFIKHNNEKLIAKSNSFAALMSNLDRYCLAKNPLTRSEALKSVSNYLIFASNNLIPLLKDLDSQISQENYSKIKELRIQIFNIVSSESNS